MREQVSKPWVLFLLSFTTVYPAGAAGHPPIWVMLIDPLASSEFSSRLNSPASSQDSLSDHLASVSSILKLPRYRVVPLLLIVLMPTTLSYAVAGRATKVRETLFRPFSS